MDAKTTTKAGLERYVGYAEIEEAYGYDRRTIQRLKREGKFPREVSLPGRRGGPVTFRLADVLRWDEERRAHLTKISALDPDKLRPEQVEDAAYELAARHISNQLGQSIATDKVVLGFIQQRSPDETADEFFANWTTIWTELEERFSKLDEVQSNAVAFGLFTALRSRAALMNAKAAQLGLKPVELAMLTLAGPEGSKALLQWRDRKQGGRT